MCGSHLLPEVLAMSATKYHHLCGSLPPWFHLIAHPNVLIQILLCHLNLGIDRIISTGKKKQKKPCLLGMTFPEVHAVLWVIKSVGIISPYASLPSTPFYRDCCEQMSFTWKTQPSCSAMCASSVFGAVSEKVLHLHLVGTCQTLAKPTCASGCRCS